MHQNVTTMTEDVEALHENVLFLKELFEKIDQVEVCTSAVNKYHTFPSWNVCRDLCFW